MSASSRSKVVNYETYMSESFERLTRQPKPKGYPSNPELTFSPKLNSASGSPRSKDVVSILYEKDRLYKQRRESTAKVIAQKEVEGCTFHPELNEGVQSRFYSGKDIHQRNTEWQQYKEQKIQYIKEKNANKELEGCTFMPDISSSEQYQNDNAYSIGGYREFLERQQKARKIREELERAQAIPIGENWKHQVTIPQEFSITLRAKSPEKL